MPARNIPMRYTRPGTRYGPCKDENCRHTDCKEARGLTALPCELCNRPIGYGQYFYLFRSIEGTAVTHVSCLEFEGDRLYRLEIALNRLRNNDLIRAYDASRSYCPSCRVWRSVNQKIGKDEGDTYKVKCEFCNTVLSVVELPAAEKGGDNE